MSPSPFSSGISYLLDLLLPQSVRNASGLGVSATPGVAVSLKAEIHVGPIAIVDQQLDIPPDEKKLSRALENALTGRLQRSEDGAPSVPAS